MCDAPVRAPDAGDRVAARPARAARERDVGVNEPVSPDAAVAAVARSRGVAIAIACVATAVVERVDREAARSEPLELSARHPEPRVAHRQRAERAAREDGAEGRAAVRRRRVLGRAVVGSLDDGAEHVRRERAVTEQCDRAAAGAAVEAQPRRDRAAQPHHEPPQRDRIVGGRRRERREPRGAVGRGGSRGGRDREWQREAVLTAELGRAVPKTGVENRFSY